MEISRTSRAVVLVLILAMVVFGAFGAVRSCASDMPSGETREDQFQKPKLDRPRAY